MKSVRKVTEDRNALSQPFPQHPSEGVSPPAGPLWAAVAVSGLLVPAQHRPPGAGRLMVTP